MTAPAGITPGAVLMLAGQIYSTDPVRWETAAGGHIMYSELAHVAWSMAGAIMAASNQTGYDWEWRRVDGPAPWDQEPK